MRSFASWIVLIGVAATASPSVGGVAVREVGDNLEVTLEGRPFTTYHIGKDVGRPFFWPIVGPDGASVTRAFPNIPDAPDETRDHVWHRGLSFSHGVVEVPGRPAIDFWREGAPNQGKIVHRDYDPRPEVRDGVLTFGTRNEWVAPDGVVILDEHTVWKVADLGGGSARISATIRLAARDLPVRFGDSEEGSFAVRVATSMDEKAEKEGPRSRGPRGRVENSRGEVGAKACWGHLADWVDYSGTVAGRVVGLALFDHPANRSRARWHVRDYGLFSANPFGQKVFKDGNEADLVALGPHQALVLRYGVLVHPGGAQVGQVARRFAEYVRDEASTKPDPGAD